MQKTLFKQPDDPRCEPNDAPEGYYAVLKADISPDGSNICRCCDWRKTCQQEDTDFRNPNHRCMGYAIVTPDGQTVERRDGRSVVFKIRHQR